MEKMNPLEKCEKCPDFIFEDVQAYIQQLERDRNWLSENYDLIREENKRLEAQNAELVRKTEQLQSSMDQVQKALQDNGFQTFEELLQAYSQVKRERDAAVEDLRAGHRCFVCKLFFHNGGRCSGGRYCVPLNFEWRGVQEPPEECNDERR